MISVMARVRRGGEKMAVNLRPLYLECIKTSAEGLTEEPYLCLYQNGELREMLGPFRMQSGDTRRIDTFDLIADDVAIILSEEDPGGDDRLNGLRVIDDTPGDSTSREGGLRYRIVTNEDRALHHVSELTMYDLSTLFRELDITKIEYPPYYSGFHYAYLPKQASFDHNDRRYRLYFYLYTGEDEHYLHPPYCLDLLSLECENAQEWKDYPYLKVNGQKVWGPHRMRDSGDASTASIHVDPVAIYEVTSVMLWEQDDTTRDDLFGEFEIRIGSDFEFGREFQHTYSPDGSITGNARYTLTYRVRRRERDRDGNYLECS
jgi:hypothetical protein